MTGYGYSQFGGAKAAPTAPQAVGQRLAQAAMQGGASPGMGGVGADPASAGGIPPTAMSAEPSPMLPTLGLGPVWGEDGQSVYDTTTEHSASSTRAASAEAQRRAASMTKPSAPPPPSARWQLASLGLPPLEIDLQLLGGGGTVNDDDERDPMTFGGR